MSIYVTGDTHGSIDIRKLNSRNFRDNSKLDKSDYVIVAGDFGLVWDDSKHDLYYRNWLHNKNFTTLFVDGNHENFDLIEKYPVESWNGGRVQKINDSIIHLMRGEIYVIDGFKFFVMGGAVSIDRGNRVEGASWWRQELPNKKELDNGIFNLDKHKWKVDYIITHTCPLKILNMMYRYDIGIDRGLERYFNYIYDNTMFKHWYFGHYHIDKIINNKITVVFDEIIKIG